MSDILGLDGQPAQTHDANGVKVTMPHVCEVKFTFLIDSSGEGMARVAVMRGISINVGLAQALLQTEFGARVITAIELRQLQKDANR